jgi:chemotaxis signal transduction protein
MQAIHKELTVELQNRMVSETKLSEDIDNYSSPFTSDEIIFSNEKFERPYTRYGYKIANMNFLVPEKTISEVINNPCIFNLPNSPTWIEGLVNVRGNIIPVMNMGKLLKNYNNEKLTSVILISKPDYKLSIAILISDLPVSLEYNESKALAINYPDELHDFISDGFNQNNIDWIEFNPEKLFKKLAKKDND